MSDPSYTLLVSNLMAEVQLFCTHGSPELILFSKNTTGIKTGSSSNIAGNDVIGISDLAADCWNNADTKLVSYMGCNTGGEDGNTSTDSLVYQTCDGGAYTSIGFTKTVTYGSMYEWSKNFNMYLASGYGVYSAAIAANEVEYINNDVKYLHLSYNSSKTSSPDLKLGIYATNNASELNSIKTSYVNNSLEKKNLLKADASISYDSDANTLFAEIKNINSEFNEKDYILTKSIMTVSDVSTGEQKNIEFIDLTLKIGEYFTNSGYTARVEDNKIKAIYDNTILEKKQTYLSSNEENFDTILSKTEEEEIVNQKLEELKKSVKDTSIKVDKENLRYFYDIENNKKYLEIPYISEITYETGAVATLSDVIMYEFY